jgi:hypothetical protein
VASDLDILEVYFLRTCFDVSPETISYGEKNAVRKDRDKNKGKPDKKVVEN